MTFQPVSKRTLLATAAFAVLLAGCNKAQTSAPALDALPLTTADTPAAAPAPVAAALPQAAPARLVRVVDPRQRYAYLDRAYAESQAFADAPPDYAVDYRGERPWIWRGSDGSERVVERTPEGLRYFYYEPGAEAPYLVQDPDGYAYGYGDGGLAAVYGPDGQLASDLAAQRRAEIAGRYLAWAAALRAASLNTQHQAVEAARWDARRAEISAARSNWAAAQSRQQAWAAYHDAHQAEQQAHWADEQSRREAEATRYARSAPPARVQDSSLTRPSLGPAGGALPGGHGVYAGGPPRDPRSDGSPSRGPDGDHFAQRPQLAQVVARPQDQPRATDAAAADRAATLTQQHAAAEAQRREAETAHAAQVQATRQAEDQRRMDQRQAGLDQAEAARAASAQAQRAAAQAQRQATLRQGRAEAEAVQNAGVQAHLAQQHEAMQQAAQRAAAQDQRQAVQLQARAEAEAQRHAADQAHAAQAEASKVAQAHAAQQAPPAGDRHGPPPGRDHPDARRADHDRPPARP